MNNRYPSKTVFPHKCNAGEKDAQFLLLLMLDTESLRAYSLGWVSKVNSHPMDLNGNINVRYVNNVVILPSFCETYHSIRNQFKREKHSASIQ